MNLIFLVAEYKTNEYWSAEKFNFLSQFSTAKSVNLIQLNDLQFFNHVFFA